jgi:hypothetical protein
MKLADPYRARRGTERVTGEARRIHQRANAIACDLFRVLRIPRPACECLSKRQIEMHHVDYSQPWLVAFLCHRCHCLEHFGKLLRSYRLYDLRNGIEEFSP